MHEHDNDGETRKLIILRATRVFRILKMSRHSSGMQLVGKTIAAAYHDLVMTGSVLFISILVYASLVYYAEQVGITSYLSHPENLIRKTI